MPERENEGAVPEGSLALVPEVYYDVIARILAGAPFVGYSLYTRGFIKEFGGGGSLIAFVCGSYLTGHVLATASAAMNAFLWRKWVLGWLLDRIPLHHKFDRDSLRSDFRSLYSRIDYIAKHNNNWGTILKKMEAGAALSDNLFCGFCLFAILYGLQTGFSRREGEVAIAVGLLLLGTVVLRRMVLIGRQDTLMTLLEESRLKSKKVDGKHS